MWLRTTIRAAGYASEGIARLSSLSPDEQDENLIRQAENGNVPAFEKLTSRYDRAILGLLLMLTSSEQEALDLCRATFITAYLGLRRRNTESLYLWLYRLAAAHWLEWSKKEAATASPSRVGVDLLSARERLVFTLKAGQHLALRTVAHILDVPEETVERTFSRAVCKLQMSARDTD
jgi:DNA-directed RNA polymerase specialized sigma24 family protein